MCVCVHKGRSKSSKPDTDFKFVTYFSHLHEPHPQRMTEI